MRHVLSATVQNVPGVLAHVAGMFASRGFNIDSLAVGETEDANLSRMTFVVKGDDGVLDQVRKQLDKVKGQAIAEMKMQGIEYNQRMEELGESVTSATGTYQITGLANVPVIVATWNDLNYVDTQYPSVAAFRADMKRSFPDREDKLSMLTNVVGGVSSFDSRPVVTGALSWLPARIT